MGEAEHYITGNAGTPVNHVSSKQLHKCRYSPTTSLAASDYELDECEGLTAEEMEDHEHYVALFQPEEYVQTIVIQESALNIVELDTVMQDPLYFGGCQK
ncbi:hypothetical protein FKM82_023584 [Ascaphus truei]